MRFCIPPPSMTMTLTSESETQGGSGSAAIPACSHCAEPLRHTFVDLGKSPLCETYLRADQLNDMEPFYPLHVRVCDKCFLVQLPEYVRPENIFTEYAYFSSFSDSWLAHARRYTEKMIERLHLTAASQVVEIASNDGYLLQYFVAQGIPALGIEPAANVAAAALKRGVKSVVRFFGRQTATDLAAQGVRPDLLLGNNVLAHVPDINDFVGGMKILLAPQGVITMEFPHLLRLIEGNQYDTIYHEHFSYLSLTAVDRIFRAHGLTVFDVEELPTHGGSLRIYARHSERTDVPVGAEVTRLLDVERGAGFLTMDFYRNFGEAVMASKRRLLEFLIKARDEGRTVAAYGAPGKGNTLLNYCGIRTDLVAYAVDRNPYKHGRLTPGTHIPIFPPERIAETRPDYVLILPWNLKDEIMVQLASIREWGGQFVVPIPRVQVYP
jgi:2-polyprenyl-3-methyl-5-hydroxy-6-metoxy-1,4-benzoquinol methylase